MPAASIGKVADAVDDMLKEASGSRPDRQESRNFWKID
jgi:hypothetical protein